MESSSTCCCCCCSKLSQVEPVKVRTVISVVFFCCCCCNCCMRVRTCTGRRDRKKREGLWASGAGNVFPLSADSLLLLLHCDSSSSVVVPRMVAAGVETIGRSCAFLYFSFSLCSCARLYYGARATGARSRLPFVFFFFFFLKKEMLFINHEERRKRDTTTRDKSKEEMYKESTP